MSDWPGKDSSSSDDDVPLSKLLKRTPSDEKQLSGITRRLTYSSNANSKKDKSGEDSKLKTLSTILPAEVKYVQLDILLPLKANGTKFCFCKSSPVVASDDSDDEPLIKMKTISAPAKKPVRKGNTSPRSKDTNNKKAGGYYYMDNNYFNNRLIVLSHFSKKKISASQMWIFSVFSDFCLECMTLTFCCNCFTFEYR